MVVRTFNVFSEDDEGKFLISNSYPILQIKDFGLLQIIRSYSANAS